MTSLKKISILVKKSFYKDFRKIPKPYQIKIKEKIDELQKNPFLGKQLKGNLSHIRRIRIGIYRLGYVYEEDKLAILILKAGQRKDFYGDISRLFL